MEVVEGQLKLLMKCTGKECVPDCIKCKKCKRKITYHFIENIGQFSNHE